jgi:hypothetical protein
MLAQKNYEDPYLIRKEDIKVDSMLLFDDDHVNAYIGTLFDVDRRFGTDTRNANTAVNMYADYHPLSGRLQVYYIVTDYTSGESSPRQPIHLRESEKYAIIQRIVEVGEVW